MSKGIRRAVYIVQAGLPEYHGEVDIDLWGEGVGSTLQDVCEDIIRQFPDKGKYFKVDPLNPDQCSDWGFKLCFKEDLP